MSNQITSSLLRSLSDGLAGTVRSAAQSIVRVDDGSRLTATGIVWATGGTIVTTSHGVERDEDLTVVLNDGAVVPATLIGRDPDTDIAVLSAPGIGAPIMPRAAEAPVGSLVLAVATPGRSGLHATLGIISARNDTESRGRSEYLLHTDAVMLPGFSGGALVDVDGAMVGMINLMFGRSRTIALGVPVVQHVADALLTSGRVPRAYLGVRTQEVSLPEPVGAADWTSDRGLLIAQVEPGSPANRAGLLLGDTILRIGDIETRDVDALRSSLRAHGPGDELTVEVLRGGALHTVHAILDVE